MYSSCTFKILQHLKEYNMQFLRKALYITWVVMRRNDGTDWTQIRCSVSTAFAFSSKQLSLSSIVLTVSHFCLLRSVQHQFYREIVDFSGIQTRIVEEVGKHADHLTITTAHRGSANAFCIKNML